MWLVWSLAFAVNVGTVPTDMEKVALALGTGIGEFISPIKYQIDSYTNWFL